MAPAVEVLFAPATEAYKADPTTIHPVLEMVLETAGCQGVYHGIPVEDPNQLVLIIVWETLESHQALINDTVKYPILGGHLARAADLSGLDMFHVYFAPAAHLAPALNAPYTSYLKLEKRAAGKSAADAEAVFNGLTGLPTGKGNHGGAGGKAVEKDEQVLIFGWDTPEHHGQILKEEPAAGIVKELHATVGQHKRGHVKFNVFKRYEA